MKKYLIALLLPVFCVLLTFAQNPKEPNKSKNDLDIEKNLFFSKSLSLSAEQAPRFWTLYNDFKKKESVIREKEKSLGKKSKMNLSDDQFVQVFDELVSLETQRFELKQNFYKSLDKVLSPKQKLLFVETQRDYRKTLLKKVIKIELPKK